MFTTRRLLAGLTVTALAGLTAPALALDIATFDANQFNTNGFTFLDFSAPGAVGTSDGFINLDIATDLDSANGLFGGLGSDVVADFDAAATQLEVTLRVDPLNLASDFRVVLGDTDSELTGDEFQFLFSLDGVTPGEVVTLTQSLLDPGPVFSQAQSGKFPGDNIQNYGLTQMQIQSAFAGTDRLKIDVASVKLIDPDNPLIAELTAQRVRDNGGFTFGSFSEPGGVDFSGNNFIINADPASVENPGGGVGLNSGFGNDFDATQAAIEIEAKLLPGNAAETFNILLGDLDGDDSGPGLGSEDYFFNVQTDNFNADEFSTFQIQLGSGTESSFGTTFAFENGGDGLQNFDLSQIQIQAALEDAGLLAMEIARVTIIESIVTTALAGDFNGNGAVEQGDLDLVLGNWGASETPDSFVANLDGLADGVDQEELDAVLGNWGASLAGSVNDAVPEPATAAVLLAGSLGLTLRRRGNVA